MNIGSSRSLIQEFAIASWAVVKPIAPHVDVLTAKKTKDEVLIY
jgi:hypothetical protein